MVKWEKKWKWKKICLNFILVPGHPVLYMFATRPKKKKNTESRFMYVFHSNIEVPSVIHNGVIHCKKKLLLTQYIL